MNGFEKAESKKAVADAKKALADAKEQRKVVEILMSALRGQREQNHFGEMIRRAVEGKTS